MYSKNIFSNIPLKSDSEIFEDVIKTENMRIERILSYGQSSPAEGWYDQDENEWVIVLQGSGTLQFDSGETVILNSGDYINIPAHKKHKVTRTDPNNITLWIAVFYK